MGSNNSSVDGVLQTVVLLIVMVILAVPVGIAINVWFIPRVLFESLASWYEPYPRNPPEVRFRRSNR